MRRLLCVFLTAVMLLGVLPIQVLSEGDLLQIEEIAIEEVQVISEEPASGDETLTIVFEDAPAAEPEKPAQDDEIELITFGNEEAGEEKPAAESSIAVALEAQQRYAVAGKKAFVYEAAVSGGVAPYTVSVKIALDGEEVYAEQKALEADGAFSFQYMPEAFGVYAVKVIAADATGADAEAQAEIPVAVEEYETAATWEKTLKGVALTGDWAKDLVKVAKSQLGYAESERNFIIDKNGVKHGYTRYGDWYGAAYSDWCAMFVSFCLNYAGISAEDVPYAASCSAWIDQMQAIGAFASEGYAPKAGDIIFLDYDGISHVGIVIKVDGGEITTIEGNVGKTVARQSYDLNDECIVGFASMDKLAEKAGASLEVVQVAEVQSSSKNAADSVLEIEGDDLELIVFSDEEETSKEAMNNINAVAAADKNAYELNEVVTITVNIENGRSYQWQSSKDGGTTWKSITLTGYNTKTLTFPATDDRLGRLWHCIGTDANGEAFTSNNVTLTKAAAGANAVAAADKDAYELNEVVTITVNVENGRSYQWQSSKDNGATWKSITLTGYNTKTLTFPATDDRLGRLWHCIGTDANGNAFTSNDVTLTKAGAGANAVAAADKDAYELNEVVTITVNVENGQSYQWQSSKDGGTTWKSITLTGFNTKTLTFPATDDRLGRLWHCIGTDANGNAFTSNNVTLTKAAVGVQATAAADKASYQLNETVNISVNVENGRSYQWQSSKDNGATWKSITLTGYNTKTLTFPATDDRLGRVWRCTGTDADGNEFTSNEVTLRGASYVVTAQADKASYKLDEIVNLTVNLENGRAYQWQSSKDGGATWKSITLTGYNTKTLTFGATDDRLSRVWRCFGTDSNGNAFTSNEITLEKTVEAIEATAAADKAAYALDELVTLTVDVENGRSYQWQNSTDGGTTWKNTTLAGYNTNTLSFGATEARAAKLYRCVGTDSTGAAFESNAVGFEISQNIVENDVTYSIKEDGTLCVVSYAGTSASLVIPEKVQDMTVTEIGEGAFENNETLVSIDLPDTITVIGKRAFKNCINLANMN